MQCFHPQFFNGSQVPCGRCQACRVNKTKEWSVRLLHESEYWPTALFLTLTYNDDSLPEFKSLVKDHLVLFYKRLRKQLTSPTLKCRIGDVSCLRSLL